VIVRVRPGAPVGRSFLCTSTDFGTATVKDGKATFEKVAGR